MGRYIVIKITGKVQGVWFRKSAKEFADNIGLIGFVKNNVDKSVTIKSCGTSVQLDKLVMWCKTGSKMARVDKIKYNIYDKCYIKYKDFKIL